MGVTQVGHVIADLQYEVASACVELAFVVNNVCHGASKRVPGYKHHTWPCLHLVLKVKDSSMLLVSDCDCWIHYSRRLDRKLLS